LTEDAEQPIPRKQLCLLALALILAIDRLGRPHCFLKVFPWFPQWLDHALQGVPRLAGEDLNLVWTGWFQLIWWCGCCWLCFFVIPCAWMRYHRIPIAPVWGRIPHWRGLIAYFGMYLGVLPLLVYVHTTPRFRETYPFFHDNLGHPYLTAGWEVFYGMMFFSLEFFFRGFLIRVLTRGRAPGPDVPNSVSSPAQSGSAPTSTDDGVFWSSPWPAIWFSTIPYFLIHYTKPLPEMLGAFPAGLILGYASYRSGSIWGGLLVHLGVAFTMDTLQLLHIFGIT
jgi:membrane protease YdiL (CAAX protease family)